MKNARSLLAAFALVSISATAAQFKFENQTLTVPDGFVVERVAAPPLIERPISMSFDEAGNLYVTDSAGMAMPVEKQVEVKPHRVMRLDAAAANGVFGKSAVFADKMMFPEGCLWLDGALYVSGPPQIWKLTAEKREVWLDGKTLTHCANDLHGPYAGRDGWIYWCKGAFAQQTYTIHDKPFTTRASHIFRARRDGSEMEPVLTGGMDNPVGFTVLPNGERIMSCTFFQNPGGGKRDGLIHAIYGGVYGKIHDVINGHTMTGEVMPVLAHLGAAAPCGLTCLESDTLTYRGNLLTCCFNLHKVVRHELKPDGATYIATASDFLSSDSPDFHPTDVLEDADGSVLVADTGGWYKICCPTSHLAKPDVLGAIYRVRRKDAAPVKDPRGLGYPWATLTAVKIKSLLGDARPYVRRRAIEMLNALGAGASEVLVAGLASPNAEMRLNAVWTLAHIDGADARKAIRGAINDQDDTVAQAAIHAAGLWRDAAFEALAGRMGGERKALARAAAEALGRIGDKRAVPVLLDAAARIGGAQGDPARVLLHSITYALIEIGDAQATAAGLEAKSAEARCAALIALDQMPNGGLTAEKVLAAMARGDAVETQTARWIAGRHPEWGAKLAEHFAAALNGAAPEAGLDATLAGLAKSPAIQELLARALHDEKNAGAKRIALSAMVKAGLKEAPGVWLDALSASVKSGDAEFASAVLRTVRALMLPKGGHAALTAALLELSRSGAAEMRVEALAAAGALPSVDDETFKLLIASVAAAQPMGLRSGAAAALARAKLSAEQTLALADALKDAGALEVQQLLRVFERGGSEELGKRLVAGLQASPGKRGLRSGTLRDALAKFPKSVQEGAAELIASLNADAAQQAAHLTELAGKLPAGDVTRGHAAFLNSKAACASCHAIGYVGGNLGPDLTKIGQTRTERDLLEAIIYPSASIVRSYEPVMVATKNGERVTGILRKDAPDEVLLATGAQTEARISRAEITRMEPGAVSMMPDGVEQLLTAQELADVIAFLKAAK